MTVDYSDKSGHRMPQFVSDQITIDTTPAEITIAGIENESANKDETIGFTVTASDINIDALTFVPLEPRRITVEKLWLPSLSRITFRLSVEAGSTLPSATCNHEAYGSGT